MEQLYQKAYKYYINNQFIKAIEIFNKLPKTPQIKYNIATCLKETKLIDNIVKSTEIYIQLLSNKNCDELHNDIKENLVSATTYFEKYYSNKKNYKKAIEFNNMISKIIPNNHCLLNNKGKLYSEMCNFDKSLEYYLKSYHSNTNFSFPLHNYLFESLYLMDTFHNNFRKHIKYGIICYKNYNNYTVKNCVYNNKLINIGYVSGDFNGKHPVNDFVKALLNYYNIDEFNVFCYSNIQNTNKDLFKNTIHWRSIYKIDTQKAINIIQNDKIDILFDLSTHTGENRLDIFSNRVAKIQINYIGYPFISGIPTIDYYLIDKTFGNTKLKTLQLPNCFTHYTPRIDIDCKLISPYHTNNYITFGCLNNLKKINKSVVELWDSILDFFPNSKLIIKKNEHLQFKNSDRVIFLEYVNSYRDFIYQYNLIDIALDTFPYNGTTTTCESLLMGTPVISLADRKTNAFQQNVTASLLINSNLKQLVAKNTDEFLNIVAITIDSIKNDVNYKNKIQHNFLNGNVTNTELYINDFETLIKNLYYSSGSD